jgi:hypothetical protein
MTQALYAHMNNKTIKNKLKKKNLPHFSLQLPPISLLYNKTPTKVPMCVDCDPFPALETHSCQALGPTTSKRAPARSSAISVLLNPVAISQSCFT